MKWQSWQWRMDADEVTAPRVERFTRSLEGEPILWDALVFPVLGQNLSHVLLRNVESDDLFCVCDSNGNVLEARLAESSEPWSVRMVCADALNNAKIARLFFLNESGHLRERGEAAYKIVLVRADGTGLWNTWPDTVPNRAAFHLFEDAGLGAFMRRPAMRVWGTLKDALEDPRSDAAFARHWSSASDAQRDQIIWSWPLDDRDRLRAELEDWLRCLLLGTDLLWREDDWWSLSVPDPTHIYLYSEEEWDERSIPAELRLAIERLWHHFAPFDSEVLEHDCAFAWKQNTIQAFHAEVREPTAHERLEAILRWRDWLDS